MLLQRRASLIRIVPLLVLLLFVAVSLGTRIPHDHPYLNPTNSRGGEKTVGDLFESSADESFLEQAIDYYLAPPVATKLSQDQQRRFLEDKQKGDDYYSDDDADVYEFEGSDDNAKRNGNSDQQNGNNDDATTASNVAHAAEDELFSMFYTSPSEWDPAQWFLFSLILWSHGIFFFCMCICVFIPRCCPKSTTMVYASMV